MTNRNIPPRPERDATDQSLGEERAKTDHELSQRRHAIEEDADSVVRRAQDTADQVLKAARDKEDLKLELTAASPQTRASVAAERRRDDRLLQKERATASQQLQEERKERARVLANLLATEREQTDLHLLSERTLADEAVTARDSFLGIVSHDLRTMISAISMTAGLLARNASHDDEEGRSLRGGLEQIQRTSARMHQLIGDLLDVSSIEAGRLSVTPTEQDTDQILRDMVEAFEAAALTSGITLGMSVPQERLLARCDYGRIIQVLTNLVGNALKFTPKGGRISIRAEAAGDEVHFSVEDTGPGLPGDTAGRLFERFWKAPGNVKPGLGLGLFISRSIVEAHGGRIWAEPRAGAGSIFHFTVPRVRPRTDPRG